MNLIWLGNNYEKPCKRVIHIELYNLEPIGIKTDMIESLTSYLARLAEAHSVTVGMLFGKIVAKELGKEYLLKSCYNGGIRLYAQGAGTNGLGKQAEDLSTALFNLTGREVSALTLQSWKDIFPRTDLLRKNKAWCPICLEGWKNNLLPVYEPLIWSFKAINTCVIHGAYLNTNCPLCGSEIPLLSSKSRNGYCSFCGCWLGAQNTNYPNKKSAHSSWDHFVVSNIGGLLIGETHLPSNYIVDLINRLVIATGGLNDFSQHFNIAKSTVSEWCNSLHKPSLNMILKLCYSLGVNILDLGQPFTLPDKNPEKNSEIKNKPDRRYIDWSVVKTTLEEIISHSDTNAPSVGEVARDLNINKRSLYYHFSALCKEISRNHSSRIQVIKTNRIENGCTKIREAVTNAYNIGEYPSKRKIENALPSSISLREQAFKEFWKSLS